jgi:hypothetical protein
MVNHKDMKELSDRISCGYPLARDLLILAGGDKDIVIDASESTTEGIETVKAKIIDKRFENIEAI